MQGAGQQGDGVPAGRGGRGGAGGAQAHVRHAHVVHVVLPVPQHRPPDPHRLGRRHVRALGRRVGPAAAELPGAYSRTHRHRFTHKYIHEPSAWFLYYFCCFSSP